MKRYGIIILCLCMLFGVTACSAPETEKNIMTSSASDADGSQSTETDQKILIAYFTWAENTQVENPDGIDSDATTSASVLIPGNTAKMANWIHERVGGDLHSLECI